MSKPGRPRELALVKITGEEPRDVQAVLDSIRDLYKMDCGNSRIIPSQGGGYHCFISIYKLREERP
jgi:hypothetical protein